MHLTRKELVLSRMDGEVGDRVPVLPPFQSFFANKIAGIKTKDARRCPAKVARAQIDIARRCGFDGLDMGVDGLAPIEACGSDVSFPSFGLPYTIAPVFADPQRLDGMAIPDPRKDVRLQSSLAAAEEIVREIGDELFTQASLCGPITTTGENRGLGTFISDLDGDPGTADDLIEFSIGVFERYIEEFFRLDVDALAFAEPTCAGEYLSEEQFKRFALPAIDRCAAACKRSGKKVMLHLCGDSRNVLRYLADTPIDAVCIDADINDASGIVKRKTVIGNITNSQLSSNDPNVVLNASLDCLRPMSGERFILGSGCVVPLTARVPNLSMLRYATECHMLNER